MNGPGCGRALVALAALLGAAAAAGEEPALDDTFRYQEVQAFHRLRAGGEIGLYLALQLGSYLVRPSRSAAEGGPATYSPAAKLAGGALSLDANSFGTNFAGHPLMGATLYQVARGNRLPVWESSLWAVLGSTAWELVEYREKGSINDLLVTPAAGVALGEPLFQLGAHLDRSPRTAGRAVLAWVVAPWKKLHDLWDGARPERGDPGDALDWRLSAGGGAASRPAWRRPQAAVGLSWELRREPEAASREGGTRWLLDGRLSGLALAAAASPDHLDDLRLDSWVLLAALASGSATPGAGAGLVAGAGLAFGARLHAWDRDVPGDALALVQVPQLSARAGLPLGPLYLGARLDAGLALGGARSFLLDRRPEALPAAALPTVQRGFGYHFVLGVELAPDLELRWGPVAAGAGLRWDRLPAVVRPDPTPGARPERRLEERWTEWTARASLRLGQGLALGVVAARRERWSRAGEATASAVERSLAATLELGEGY